MDIDPNIIIAIVGTLVAAAAVYLGVIWVRTGGDFAKHREARAVAHLFLTDEKFHAAVTLALTPPPPPLPPKPSPEPLLLLTLMQREGRLIDFLLENIDGADNETLGAGVRTIHQACQKVLKEHLDMEPVLKGEEKATVTVPAGFDPSAVRLTGNVTGSPPFNGSLEHHGWRVTKIKLAKPPEGQDAFVIAPAEVELA